MNFKKEGAEILIEHLQPYFDYKRYTPAINPLQFVRPTPSGFTSILCSLSGSDDELVIEFHQGIRLNQVEQALAGIFSAGDYYHFNSQSFSVSRHYLDPNRSAPRTICRNEKEVIIEADRFIDYMDRYGFEFFKNYSSYVQLDTLLNDRRKVSAKWSNHNYQRCFRAMILAKFTGRLDYDTLFFIHQQYLIERGFKGSILAKFNSAFFMLKHHSIN